MPEKPVTSTPMNWKHVKALLAGGPIYIADMDGKRLISNGHFAFILDEGAQVDVTRAKEMPGFAARWKQWEGHPFSLENPGACYGEGETLSRSIGKIYVAERYFRCFAPEATWSYAGSQHLGTMPARVFLDNAMIGVVMPRHMGDRGTAIEPTDEDVFAPISSHENEWYLISQKALDEHIEAAERERERAEEAIEEAEGRLEAANEELRSLRGRRAAAKKARGESDAA